MSSKSKHELAEFVIKRAFEPVMHAKPDGRSDADKKKLEHVQKATRAEIERYRGYNSAKEVVTNFHRDLSSEPAKKVHRELKSLHLPTIGDIRGEFDKRAEQHGVSAGH